MNKSNNFIYTEVSFTTSENDVNCTNTRSVSKNEKETETFCDNSESNNNFYRFNATYEEAIELTGFGKYNFFMIIVCGLCIFCVNIEMYSISFILPSIACEMSLDIYYKGILTSSNFIGIISTSWLMGYMSDIFGRKIILVISLFMCSISSIIAAFMTSFWGYCMMRLLNGIVISGPSAIIFAFISEFQNTKSRPISMAATCAFVPISIIILPILSYTLLSSNIEIVLFGFTLKTWRLLTLTNAIPSLVMSIVFLLIVKESPKYLHYGGKPKACLEILKSMYSINTGLKQTNFAVKAMEYNRSSKQKGSNILGTFWNGILPIFRRPVLKYNVVSFVLHAIAFAQAGGLYVWYPYILSKLIHSSDNNVTISGLTICESFAIPNQIKTGNNCVVDGNIYVETFFNGVACLMGYIVWIIISKFVRNRSIFVVISLVSAASFAAISVVRIEKISKVLFIMMFAGGGLSISLISAILTELVPTNISGTTICLSLTCGRIGCIITSSILGALLKYYCTTTFLLFAVVNAVSAALAFIYPRKTRTK